MANGAKVREIISLSLEIFELFLRLPENSLHPVRTPPRLVVKDRHTGIAKAVWDLYLVWRGEVWLWEVWLLFLPMADTGCFLGKPRQPWACSLFQHSLGLPLWTTAKSSGHLLGVPCGWGALWHVKKSGFSEWQIISLKIAWGPQRHGYYPKERGNTYHEEKTANVIVNTVKTEKREVWKRWKRNL